MSRSAMTAAANLYFDHSATNSVSEFNVCRRREKRSGPARVGEINLGYTNYKIGNGLLHLIIHMEFKGFFIPQVELNKITCACTSRPQDLKKCIVHRAVGVKTE